MSGAVHIACCVLGSGPHSIKLSHMSLSLEVNNLVRREDHLKELIEGAILISEQ